MRVLRDPKVCLVGRSILNRWEIGQFLLAGCEIDPLTGSTETV